MLVCNGGQLIVASIDSLSNEVSVVKMVCLSDEALFTVLRNLYLNVECHEWILIFVKLAVVQIERSYI